MMMRMTVVWLAVMKVAGEWRKQTRGSALFLRHTSFAAYQTLLGVAEIIILLSDSPQTTTNPYSTGISAGDSSFC